MVPWPKNDLDALEIIAERRQKHDYLCPNCRSKRVTPSHGPFDGLLRIFGRKPYWCHLCSARFYIQDAGHATG